jgi:hypothetical protein
MGLKLMLFGTIKVAKSSAEGGYLLRNHVFPGLLTVLSLFQVSKLVCDVDGRLWDSN